MPKRKFTFISARHEKSRSSGVDTGALSISCTITKRISTSEWAKHRDIIREKYIDNGWILDDVLQYLCYAEGFKPSKHQLSLQLNKWGFVKKSSHLRKSSQTSQAYVQDISPGDNGIREFARSPGTSFFNHIDLRSIRPKNSTGNLSNTTTLVSSAASIYQKSAALEKLAAIDDDDGRYEDGRRKSAMNERMPSLKQTIQGEDDWAVKLSEELDRTRLSFDFFDGMAAYEVRHETQNCEMAFSKVPTLARSLSSSTLSDYAEFRSMKRRLENPITCDKEDLVPETLASLERLSLDHIFNQGELQNTGTRPSTSSGSSASTASWTEAFFGADIWQ